MKKSVYLPNQQGYNPEPKQSYYVQPKNPASVPTSTRLNNYQQSMYYNRPSASTSTPHGTPGIPKVGKETRMIFNRELDQYGLGPSGSPPSDEPPRPWASSSCNLLCHCRECVPAHTQHRCEKMRDPQFQRHCVCRCPMCPVHGQKAIIKKPSGEDGHHGHRMHPGQTTKAMQQGWAVIPKHKHDPKKKHTKGHHEEGDSSSSSEDE